MLRAIVLSTLLFFAGLGHAYASGASYSSDATLNFAGNGKTVTVMSGSTANSVAVGPTSVDVVTGAGDTLTIRSANKWTLNNNAGLTPTCGATYSEIVVPQNTTVIITPGSVCSGGSPPPPPPSGGGGGGSSPSPTPTPPTPSPVPTPAPAPTPAPSFAVVKGDLNGDEVINLADFSIAAFWYNKPLSAEMQAKERAVFNGDGKIDLVDFSIMAFYYR